VFADTGWESPVTYEYLDTLRNVLGITIDVVRPENDMVESIRKRAGFPARMQRWCTQELKAKPLKQYHEEMWESGCDTISAVGIRADESTARAKLPEWEDCSRWGGWVWRPLLLWTVEDVLRAHHRHGVPVNPLYERGHNRVGCYPCIMSGKQEIKLVAQLDPGRIDLIEKLEAECEAERVVRNLEKPGRYAHKQASFFQSRTNGAPMTIRETVTWSNTKRGGKQLELIQDPPDGGCFRWGMCEAPGEESDE